MTKPSVDFAALDEARMDDSSDAGASPIDPVILPPEPTEEMLLAMSMKAYGFHVSNLRHIHDLYAGLYSFLRNKPAPRYRIRAKGLDVVHAGPWSITEVPND